MLSGQGLEAKRRAPCLRRQAQDPRRDPVDRVVDLEAEATTRHLHLDVASREDERQRREGPQVAADDVQAREGAAQLCQRHPD